MAETPDRCVISPPSSYIRREPYFPAIALPHRLFVLTVTAAILQAPCLPSLRHALPAAPSLVAVAHRERPSRARAPSRVGSRTVERGLDRGGLPSTPPASIQGHPGTLLQIPIPDPWRLLLTRRRIVVVGLLTAVPESDRYRCIQCCGAAMGLGRQRGRQQLRTSLGAHREHGAQAGALPHAADRRLAAPAPRVPSRPNHGHPQLLLDRPLLALAPSLLSLLSSTSYITPSAPNSVRGSR
ncbi:hypothetical protein FOMPIDRAFT_1056526 [Fomitopsis schrenkii]|uniref:Uncharacterized protein n=1 Tax=Fomitopsis schrenkii TaxID=2126942 RepID=S8DNF1_FOMSC|nr:hypothetical protein FOMPIDRAFT_1056526 [Fomitopsis schrenkii]